MHDSGMWNSIHWERFWQNCACNIVEVTVWFIERKLKSFVIFYLFVFIYYFDWLTKYEANLFICFWVLNSILFICDPNVCVILCIVMCSLDVLRALMICLPRSRLLNQFQSAVSALVQKSKIGRRNLKSSSLVLTVATVVGGRLQCCW